MKTEREAEDLIYLHCGYNSVRKVYQVLVEWDMDSAGGITAAVARCRRRFGFPVEET